jgi:hypothetical protein
MQMPFVERNTEGDVLLAIVPTVLLARIEMGIQHDVKDLVDSMAVQATFKKGPIDSDSSRNTVDFGGSSSDTNGTGHYLHRFDKSHVERGGSVKNFLMKGPHTLDKTVGKFATAFECVYKGSIMNEYDKSIERRFPSTDDIWESANTVGLAAGIKKGILPPFNGCKFYSSSSLGFGNNSESHHDLKNTRVSMGAACDAHASLTDTGHVLFLVHTPIGDGTWTAHAIPQEYMCVTYF